MIAFVVKVGLLCVKVYAGSGCCVTCRLCGFWRVCGMVNSVVLKYFFIWLLGLFGVGIAVLAYVFGFAVAWLDFGLGVCLVVCLVVWGVCECVCDCWLLYFLVLRLLRLIWFASNAVDGLDL